VHPDRIIPNWKAIAAMTEDRVIGIGPRIPWHLPEDFRWFKQCTHGKVVVMGSRTFAGLGRPLPGRTNLVLTRDPAGFRSRCPWILPAEALTPPDQPGGGNHDARAATPPPTRIGLVTSLEDIELRNDPGEVFICGGAQIYEAALPKCSELLLTRVRQPANGDVLFPAFEGFFHRCEVLRETPDFTLERWVRNPTP
jgi:dihydrofolate reductase